MVNHSCVPNAIVAFANRRAYLRAESPIRAGDEITISYIGMCVSFGLPETLRRLPTVQDYTKPKIFRQRGLELYHFTCSCPRCAGDLNVYQVCRVSPLVGYNALSIVPDAGFVLVNPPIDMDRAGTPSLRAQIDTIYAMSAPEARVSPADRLSHLRRQWKLCEPLIAASMWAVEPLANIFQQVINYYSEQHNYHHALAVECFVALHSDPYKYVAPFKQWRLKGLLMIAKTLTNTAMPSDDELKKVHPAIIDTLEKTDGASLYQAILLMVVHYAPMGHSQEWQILAGARDMLKDVEGVDGRQRESSILHDWIKKPDQPAAAAFVRQRVMEPVQRLAGCAIDVVRADLETD